MSCRSQRGVAVAEKNRDVRTIGNDDVWNSVAVQIAHGDGVRSAADSIVGRRRERRAVRPADPSVQENRNCRAAVADDQIHFSVAIEIGGLDVKGRASAESE